ncbi:MAG: dUTP diphosphatase [Candidatus Omnitrophica bacterium]|nr:dUTP diphosphatase [Candidatus Omnitrophota bacterium]
MDIKVKRKSGCEDLSLPRYATDGSSGMDLYADVEGEVVLETGSIQLISTGLYIAVPRGYEAEIRPRSGLALKHGISLVNSPGTIDSDYRGLLSIILINHGKDPFVVKRGERIAQMVIKEVTRARWEEVGELEETVRSSGGFGHSGI